MAWSTVRGAAIGAIVSCVAAWTCGDARADGLTFLSDPPAGVFVTGGGGGGAATTTDGEIHFGNPAPSTASWTVSSSQLELSIEQLTTTDAILPICLASGSFVFTVDTPCTYSLSGQYAYFPHVEGTSAFGYGYAILNLKDQTDGVYLFRNVLDGAPSSGTSFEVGEDTGDLTDYLEGSLVGTFWPGHAYVFDFWVQTINYYGGPEVEAEALFHLDAQPFGLDEFADWTEDIAASFAATPLSQVAAPNAKAAAGRLDSLVGRLEDAAEAIRAGHLAAARVLLDSVRVRIDGVSKPEDWLVASPTQSALLSQVDALLAALD